MLLAVSFMGIAAGVGWVRLWGWLADENYAYGEQCSFLQLGAYAAIGITIVSALVSRIVRPGNGKFVLEFLLPFIIVAMPSLFYDAWWDDSGLWY